MPFVAIPKGVWTPVHTTVEDSVFQNRGGQNVFLTTVPTGSLAPAEGVGIGPMGAIVIQAGKEVSAYSPNTDCSIFHIGV